MKFVLSPVEPINHGFTNPYCIDVAECRKSNVLVCGQTGSGKSLLAKGIVSVIQPEFAIHVFDSAGVWRNSPLENRIVLESGEVNFCYFTDSTVIDMSRLRIDDQKALLERYSEWIWDMRIRSPPDKPLLIVLEESQNYIANLRSKLAQNLFRLLMSGRNLGTQNPDGSTNGVRVLMISPRLNNISAECRFLANQQYIGLANETNVLSKVKSLFGKDVAHTVQGLKVGEFIYSKPPNPPIKIIVPEYRNTRQPVTTYTRKSSQTTKADTGGIIANLIRIIILLAIVWVFI